MDKITGVIQISADEVKKHKKVMKAALKGLFEELKKSEPDIHVARNFVFDYEIAELKLELKKTYIRS